MLRKYIKFTDSEISKAPCCRKVLAGILLVVWYLGGCSTDHYKKDADQEVYKIIEAKWQGEFGPQTNYRISDVEPGPNDIDQTSQTSISGKLSLAQAVAMATACNRSYQNEKEQLYLSALDLTLQRHSFNPQFFGLFGGGYLLSDEEESVDFNGELGFDLLLADGAQISTSIGMEWLRYLTGDPDTSLGSVLSATVSQPLLRGRGRKIVQENLTQAERNTLYQVRSFNRFRKSFVISVITQYYQVLRQLDRVKNAKSNYDNLLVSQEQISAMAQTGRLPRFEEGEARQSTLSAENNYITSQEVYKQQLDQFKIRLALPTDAVLELDPCELDVLETIGISEPDFSLELAVQTALDCRLDLANTRDKVDDAARKVDVAADKLGAELDLIGSARAQSEDKTNLGNLQIHRGDYSFGFEADLPLDRKSERNAYREALINLTRQQRTYEEEVDQVKFEVRQAYRDLREAYSTYLIQLSSLKLAEQRVAMQLDLLQEGRATTRQYLFAQEDLLQAQNSKTSALVEFTLAKLNFYRDIGLLQVRPDGLWQQPEPKALQDKKVVSRSND